MFTLVLTIHILGAILMGLLAVLLLASIFKNDVQVIEKYTRFLAWNLGFELISGSLLTVLSLETMSFLHFCQNVSLYLFASGILFTLSALRIRGMFPKIPVLIPIAPSLVVVASTAVSLL